MSASSRLPFDPDHAQRLDRWFRSPPGSMVLELERRALEQALAHLFGYHLVQIGRIGAESSPVAGGRIRNRYLIDSQVAVGTPFVRVLGEPEMLPFRTDSIDLVVMQHTIDFIADPHRLLREAERILIPEGRLLIAGFNPWSLWGARRLMGPRAGRIPWCGRFLGVSRLREWLSLLGFDVEFVESMMFRPPLKSIRALERLRAMERLGHRWGSPLGAVYVLQAVKRVSTLTPLTPRWRLRRSLVRGGVAEPTTRNRSE